MALVWYLTGLKNQFLGNIRVMSRRVNVALFMGLLLCSQRWWMNREDLNWRRKKVHRRIVNQCCLTGFQ
jgi:hypothetical protein